MTGLRTDLLDPDKIQANLNTRRIGRKILVYDSTSSTQTVAAEYAKNREHDGLVVFAEEQTAGRGRTGNQWYSGRAESILCSIVLTYCRLNPELLSLACAVAAAEAIGKPLKSQAQIKWPNDIMLNGKKVAGILLELKSAYDVNTCIIGVGINCHQKKSSFPEDLQSIATSIDIESGSISDRISVAKRLLISMEHWLDVAGRGSKEVIEMWRSLSIQLGHRVRLVCDGREFAGNCIGIDPEKGLILQLDTGGIRMFDAKHSAILK